MSKKTHWVYGIHTILSILENTPDRINRLMLNDQKANKRLLELKSIALKSNVSVESVGLSDINKMMGEVNHQGVIAALTESGSGCIATLDDLFAIEKKQRVILILDCIEDPHNLGACIRSAAVFGVDAVIIPKDKAVDVNATVKKVACGATEIVPVITVTNMARAIELLKREQFWIYGAAEQGDTVLPTINFSGNVAITLGAEGKGLRRLTRESCDQLFSIPSSKSFSTLNVSVATGVCLYEVFRQKTSSK